MKIVLDTQILYHIAGIYINKKIDNTELRKIIASNKCYYTSFSAMEIISRFRNDWNTMRKALFPLFDINSNLASEIIIRDNIINAEDLRKIYYSPAVVDLRVPINQIFEKKITFEAEHIRFFLYLLILASILIIEDNEEIRRLERYSQFIIDVKDLIMSSFESALKYGYEIDDVQNVIKERFKELFSQMVSGLLFIKYYDINADLLKELSNDDYKKFVEKEMELDPLHLRIQSYNNPIAVLNRGIGKTKLGEYLNQYLIPNLNMKISNSVNIDFIIYKMQKLLFEDAVFKKNDIVDMHIISTIALSRDIGILTIDKNSYKFLLETQNSSVKLIQSIFPSYK